MSVLRRLLQERYVSRGPQAHVDAAGDAVLHWQAKIGLANMFELLKCAVRVVYLAVLF